MKRQTWRMRYDVSRLAILTTTIVILSVAVPACDAYLDPPWGHDGGGHGGNGQGGADNQGGGDAGPADTPVDLCRNGVRDSGETNVDCGGPTCAPCAYDKSCALDADCEAGVCVKDIYGNGTCAPACGATTYCLGCCCVYPGTINPYDYSCKTATDCLFVGGSCL